MKRLFAGLALALGLCACTVPGISIGTGAAPAPLARTTIDDRAVIIAEQAYDHALDIVDARVASGALHGPAAARVKAVLVKISAAIKAASAAQRAGQEATWSAALSEADRAYTELLAVLG